MTKTAQNENKADTDSKQAGEAYAAQASGAEIKKDMIGHNSGRPGKNPALIEIFEKTHKLIANRKQINLTMRELRAEAKKTHGIDSAVFNDELRLQQLDKAVRIDREKGAQTLQAMLGTGLQLALDLANQEAEEAKKQPAENDPVEAGRKEKLRAAAK